MPSNGEVKLAQTGKKSDTRKRGGRKQNQKGQALRKQHKAKKNSEKKVRVEIEDEDYDVDKEVDKGEKRNTPKKPQTNVFRSTFESVGKLFKDIPEPHLTNKDLLNEIRKTGFFPLFDSMFKAKTSTKKMNHQVVKKAIFSILKLYSEKDHAFKIGNTYVKFKASDMALIFGLNATGLEIGTEKSKDRHLPTSFTETHFPGVKHLTMNWVRSKIIELLNGEVQRHTDVALLMVMYLMITIFFSGSHQRLTWSHIPYVDNIKGMNSVNWPHAIHENLMEKLRKGLTKEGSIFGGCSIALLYWFCEHTNFTAKIKDSENEFPSTGMWDIEELVKKMEKCPKLVWDNMEVHKELLDISDQEKSLFVGNAVEESVVPHKDVVEEEYGPHSLAVAYEELKAENEKLKAINAELKDENVKLQNKLLEKNVEEDNNVEDVAKKSNDEKEEDTRKEVDLNNDDDVEKKSKDGKEEEDTRKEDTIDIEMDSGKQAELVDNMINNLDILNVSQNQTPLFNFSEDFEVIRKEEDPNSMVKGINERRKQERLQTPGIKILGPKPLDRPKGQGQGQGKPKGKGRGKGKGKTIVSKLEESKLDDWSKTKCFKFLNELQRGVVLYFNLNANGSAAAWTETNGDLKVLGCSVNDLMTESFIDSSTMLRDFKGSKNEKCHWESFVDTFTGEEEVFFIPYNFASTAAGKEGHHCTLLVLDRKANDQWKHYDSMGFQHRTKKVVMRDAATILSHLGPMLNIKLRSLGIKEWLVTSNIAIEIVSHLPDQGSTVNCALFVCKFMEFIAKNQKIPATIPDNEMLELRANLSFEILSDKHQSWDEEVWKNEQITADFDQL